MSKPNGFKVCVGGGAGGIGQPLCLFMAMNDSVRELCVYDFDIAMVLPQSVATDLSHIEKRCKVSHYTFAKAEKPVDKLSECLLGCDLVIVPAGLSRKPGMSDADLLGSNAGIAKGIVEACGKHCPNAIVALVVNQVNSIVPAMCKLYEKMGLEQTKVIGVTTLDCVRANKFVHELTIRPIDQINIPVVCGHAGATILPLFSQDAAGAAVPADKIAELDKRVQDAGTEVVNAKGGKGSATLSMAYAVARFAGAILQGLEGNEVTECAYLKCNVVDGVEYFSTKVTWGMNGVKTVHPLGELSAHEKTRLEEAKKQLSKDIDAGLAWAKRQNWK